MGSQLNIEKFLVAFEIKTKKELVKHFPKEKHKGKRFYFQTLCISEERNLHGKKGSLFFTNINAVKMKWDASWLE